MAKNTEHKMMFRHGDFVISQSPHDRNVTRWSVVFLCDRFGADKSSVYCSLVSSTPLSKERLVSIVDNFTTALQFLKGDEK